jgi:hypothetical protein
MTPPKEARPLTCAGGRVWQDGYAGYAGVPAKEILLAEL